MFNYYMKRYNSCKILKRKSSYWQKLFRLNFSGGSRAVYDGIFAQFYRMPHRHKSCAALCPSENLNRALWVIRNSKTMAAVIFEGPPFLKVGCSLGPHFIILHPSPSLGNNCDCFRKQN